MQKKLLAKQAARGHCLFFTSSAFVSQCSIYQGARVCGPKPLRVTLSWGFDPAVSACLTRMAEDDPRRYRYCNSSYCNISRWIPVVLKCTRVRTRVRSSIAILLLVHVYDSSTGILQYLVFRGAIPVPLTTYEYTCTRVYTCTYTCTLLQ